MSVRDERVKAAALAMAQVEAGADGLTTANEIDLIHANVALAASDALLASRPAVERMARTLCAIDYPLLEEFERNWELLGTTHYIPTAEAAIAGLLGLKRNT